MKDLNPQHGHKVSALTTGVSPNLMCINSKWEPTVLKTQILYRKTTRSVLDRFHDSGS